jgi:signal peptidase I
VNFALILFLLLVATGILWLADKFFARRHRAKGAPDPWWVEYGASFFPVILAVFFLRSFIVEPFKIPSGSMIPTLLVGDYILVNKFTYGIRLPVINKKVVDMNAPERGDVMVFRYPEKPELDYIKRVVGLPGDTVEYYGKRLRINGEPVDTQPDGAYLHRDRLYSSEKWVEQLGAVQHAILNDADKPVFVPQVKAFPYRDRCTYTSSGVRCTVPEGHFFVMGDNRDDSSDSRVWGFVPEQNIVGKAFFIWFNFDDLSRIGSFD